MYKTKDLTLFKNFEIQSCCKFLTSLSGHSCVIYHQNLIVFFSDWLPIFFCRKHFQTTKINISFLTEIDSLSGSLWLTGSKQRTLVEEMRRYWRTPENAERGLLKRLKRIQKSIAIHYSPHLHL